MDDVIVAGGGVIGLTTAVVLAERGARVRVWSRDPPEHTVSAVAGGLCWPYRIEPVETAVDWAVRSLRVFARLAGDPAETGVRMATGVTTGPWPPAPWAAAVDARPLAVDAMPPGRGPGIRARTPLIDMPVYLRYLVRRLVAAGGGYARQDINSLATVGRAAGTIVNCTGLAARELARDPAVRPVRGQLVIVENPGIARWFVDTGSDGTDSTYLLPQPYGLVLGGTAHEDLADLRPDPAGAEAIIRRCARVEPRVAGARVIGHRTGLRPYRPSVRLEREALPGGAVCVHHYGHGGAGVTASWASAVAAADLVAATG